MIKGLKPSGKYVGGTYTPVNKNKYSGPYPIIFRSSWERQFCIYCDTNPSVLKWASEPFEIPYFNPLTQKMHRYYPDFYFETLTTSGQVKKFVAEVKPYSFLFKPKKPIKTTPKKLIQYNNSLKAYAKIILKKQASKIWCEARGYAYIFLTEKDWKKLFYNK